MRRFTERAFFPLAGLHVGIGVTAAAVTPHWWERATAAVVVMFAAAAVGYAVGIGWVGRTGEGR